MRRNFREERCNISWNSIVDNFQQNYRFSFNTLPTAMSTRRSSRMPSSSAPTNGARSGPATVLATAPVAKRRRKNTIHKCSQHAGADPSSTDAKSLLPEPDLPGVAIKREGGGGALASSSCCAPSSPQATSVVLVEVPGGFSFSQAACRLAKLQECGYDTTELILFLVWPFSPRVAPRRNGSNWQLAIEGPPFPLNYMRPNPIRMGYDPHLARIPTRTYLLRTLRYHLLQRYIPVPWSILLILLLLLQSVDVLTLVNTLIVPRTTRLALGTVIFDPTQLPDLIPLEPET